MLDDGRIAICGEESFGTGADHVREKDGLWAVLCWLQILASRTADHGWHRAATVQQVLEHLWATVGRVFFQRHDYENVDSAAGAEVMKALRAASNDFAHLKTPAGAHITSSDDFSYTDPVDASVTTGQGLRFFLSDGSRFVARLSGTGSQGATIRLYFEAPESHDRPRTLEASVCHLVIYA